MAGTVLARRGSRADLSTHGSTRAAERRRVDRRVNMGLYKICEHKGRARDRCEHTWWARFKHVRVSLEKWANREIQSKTEADEVFDDLKNAVRAGSFDKRGIDPPRDLSP